MITKVKRLIVIMVLACIGAFLPTIYVAAADTEPGEKHVYIVPALVFPDDVQTITQQWQWEYAGGTYAWQVQIPEELVNDSRNVYQAVSRLYYTSNAALQQEVIAQYNDPRTLNLMLSLSYAQPRLALWSNDQKHDEYIGQMALILQNYTSELGFDSYATADFILSWVGAIPYTLTNYTELPAQTMVDGGDSKGKSILYAAILNKLDYSTVFFHYKPSTSSPKGHLAVGIMFETRELPYADKEYFYYIVGPERYYFAETSASGLQIGDVRSSEIVRLPRVIPTR